MANGTLLITDELAGRAGVTVTVAAAELTLSFTVAELLLTEEPA